MNIITAAQRRKHARAALNADYTDEHVGDYTEAAFDYSDIRRIVLLMSEFVLGFTGLTIALYNLVRPAGAGLGLVGIALALAAVAWGIHAYRRRINRITIERINHVVAAAELAHRRGRREH
ncbi:hypothetical protein HQ346_24845 [Rhodococcus sp. BP-252]|uniref:hypothetical protein n=1 Tax=unclassified Rhodococcus (in: high G+C Gram-positive bacteria) TaxID=192944 RepID=UPI001C9BB864|nr:MULTISPECIES: hypothetical protein [unclassified Rhodococcus (in: high G+C Gram-positive bacteria)]MBY6414816.1 hypothetical protein [Rhodococcus sp. BP-320]MBY6419719.1 hypothetical protein [Rhodococcus sp. BP-321]MBY6424712.1 hypothetical protein [Rhodococcus sp. BP-324]MBY6429694.1 hypothetical protein [Rhodococcus sp. BP-323]MBY6434666.1 hypothetical protein [Rhodococcus sp. BP-322]